jgi:hypothetical protein
MKKILTASAIMALCLAVGPLGIAQADTILSKDPAPLIYTYSTNTDAGVGPWVDVLQGGSAPFFETYGMKLTHGDGKAILDIYTKWGGAAYAPNVSALGGGTVPIFGADLFIDTTNDTIRNYNMAIRLNSNTVSGNSSSGMGNVYTFPNWTGQTGISQGFNTAIDSVVTSQEYMLAVANNYIYGGQFGFGKASLVPVNYTGNNQTDTTNVAWNYYDTSSANPFYPGTNSNFPQQQNIIDYWVISVTLDGINGLDLSNGLDLVWGTGFCGNDTAEITVGSGVVPLPGALVLLGAGLVRMVVYGKRRRGQVDA